MNRLEREVEEILGKDQNGFFDGSEKECVSGLDLKREVLDAFIHHFLRGGPLDESAVPRAISDFEKWKSGVLIATKNNEGDEINSFSLQDVATRAQERYDDVRRKVRRGDFSGFNPDDARLAILPEVFDAAYQINILQNG